ncbi:MAG: germination protein YpeB [Limnochordales bacterium]|nr:germination protein YpeB [Limnochordales bacterium]
MSRRIGALTTLVVVAALGFGVWQWWQARRFANALEAAYYGNFHSAVQNVETAQVALAKALAAGSSADRTVQLDTVWHGLTSAEDDIARLPLGDINLAATRKFLNQVGDYARSLARACAAGKDLEPEDWDTLAKLHTEMARFSDALHELSGRFIDGGFRWSRVMNPRVDRVRRELAAAWPQPDLAVLPATTDGNGKSRGDSTPKVPKGLEGFTDIEQRLQEMPALEYDGPFSEQVVTREPLGLTGAEITREQAIDRARSFLDGAGIEDRDFRQTGRVEQINGMIAAYQVNFRPDVGRGAVSVAVSKKGGHLVWMFNDRDIGGVRITSEEAKKAASRYLERIGLKNMTTTYTLREGATETITFVYEEDGIRMYPDQVKMKVALDNGQVVGVDAYAYFMAHHDRDLPKPRLSKEEGAKKVSNRLDVRGTRLAVIPLASGREVLAWEFDTELNGDRFLVYVNAMTGEEEQILKMVNVEGGTLTM